MQSEFKGILVNSCLKVWLLFFPIAASILTACWLGGCASQAVDPQTPLDTFAAHLDRCIPERMAHYDIPGVSVALVQDAEVEWSGNYGYADKAQARKVTDATLFEVGSISKPVTAWGVMRSAEEGRIDLDAPVERYLTRWQLPTSSFASAGVTIRRLLSHSAGLPARILPSFPPNGNPPTTEALLAEAGAQISYEPGSTFLYSNYGYTVLQLLIEEVTDRSFADYMQTEILLPLGMEHSTFAWSAALSPSLATGYRYSGEPAPANRHVAQAPGGLYTTAIDLARFATAEMADSDGQPMGRGVLQPASVEAMFTPTTETSGMMWRLSADAYGLGHAIEVLPNGRRLVSHGGQNDGWISTYYFVPETRDGIVILTNSERSFPLIAQIVVDWAQWRGIEKVKMSQAILGAATVVQSVVAVLFLVALWLGGRLAYGLVRGKRHFALKFQSARFQRFAQLLVVLILMGAWWGINRAGFMIFFPILAIWLAFSLLTCALAIVLITVFPKMHLDPAKS
jgi:CubicO group peptidase (beta-lactamase class C family)